MDERTALLKPDEVAALLRVSRHTVYRLVNNGELPATRLGPRGSLRFREADITAYISGTRGAA